MGCGKSSVGGRLSELLCCPFVDLDAEIERQTGRRIPEIFASDGETAFRKMELDTLSNLIGSISSEENIILSLGGGTIMTPECAELIQKNTECIYLRTSIDTLVERLANETSDRPLLDSNSLKSRIEELMKQRSVTYEAIANTIVDTDNHTIEALARTIAKTRSE